MEKRIAVLATRAHGVVCRSELLEAGVTRSEVYQRLRSGALIAVFAASIAWATPRRVWRRAIWRRCGPAGRGVERLRGGAAAGAPQGPAPDPEVTTRSERRVAGIATRRCRSFHLTETTLWRGIPVTSPARTLVDLAAVLNADALARACHEAGVRHHTTPKQVEALLARRPNTRGAAKLRAVLRGDAKVTLSKLESAFLALLANERLPLPDTNRPAGGRRVDCRWPKLKLTVELDSYRYHNSRHAWEQDRRYTYGDVLESPRLMIDELRRLLRPARAALP